jgi:hypothetical protein
MNERDFVPEQGKRSLCDLLICELEHRTEWSHLYFGSQSPEFDSQLYACALLISLERDARGLVSNVVVMLCLGILAIIYVL